MSAGVVPAADEEGLLFRNPFEGIGRLFQSLDPGRVIRRADNDKVIVHQIKPFGSESFGHELFFKRFGMDHDQINLPLACQIKVAPVPDPT